MVSKPPVSARSLRAFGLALIASIAFAGLAAGSASALSLEPGNGAFTVSSGSTAVSLSSGEQWSCSGKGSGSGKYTSGTSGELSLTFTNCQSSFAGFPVTCTTPGQTTGTIKTSTLAITPVYLDAAHTKFGLKLSPPVSGVFAEFSCAGVAKVWKGSLLGQITNPTLGKSAVTHTLDFDSPGNGVQAYTKVEGSGTEYQLTQGAAKVALDSTHTLSFNDGVARKWNP